LNDVPRCSWLIARATRWRRATAMRRQRGNVLIFARARAAPNLVLSRPLRGGPARVAFFGGSSIALMRGRHIVNNTVPTNNPDRTVRAMDRPALDFMGAEFRAIAEECYEGLRRIFKTEQAIIVYAANGHGAWEAAVVNVFSPGEHVLVLESGWFTQ